MSFNIMMMNIQTKYDYSSKDDLLSFGVDVIIDLVTAVILRLVNR
jgi:hypothetical protein